MIRQKQFNINSRIGFGYISTNCKMPSTFPVMFGILIKMSEKILKGLPILSSQYKSNRKGHHPLQSPLPFLPLSHHVPPPPREAPATHPTSSRAAEACVLPNSEASPALSLLSRTSHHTWRTLPYQLWSQLSIPLDSRLQNSGQQPPLSSSNTRPRHAGALAYLCASVVIHPPLLPTSL